MISNTKKLSHLHVNKISAIEGWVHLLLKALIQEKTQKDIQKFTITNSRRFPVSSNKLVAAKPLIKKPLWFLKTRDPYLRCTKLNNRSLFKLHNRIVNNSSHRCKHLIFNNTKPHSLVSIYRRILAFPKVLVKGWMTLWINNKVK